MVDRRVATREEAMAALRKTFATGARTTWSASRLTDAAVLIVHEIDDEYRVFISSRRNADIAIRYLSGVQCR